MNSNSDLKKIKRECDSKSREKSFLNGTLLFALSFIVASAGALLSSTLQAHIALVIISICLVPILFIFIYGLSAHKASIFISLGLYATTGFAVGAIPHLNDIPSTTMTGVAIPLVFLALGGAFSLSYALTQWFYKGGARTLFPSAVWSIVATLVILVSCSLLINIPYQWLWVGFVAIGFSLLICSLWFSVADHREGYVSAFCQAHFIWLEPLAWIALFAS
jgi:hypothetical protein